MKASHSLFKFNRKIMLFLYSFSFNKKSLIKVGISLIINQRLCHGCNIILVNNISGKIDAILRTNIKWKYREMFNFWRKQKVEFFLLCSSLCSEIKIQSLKAFLFMKTCICFTRILQSFFYVLEHSKKYKVELFPSRSLPFTWEDKVQTIQDIKDLVPNQ